MRNVNVTRKKRLSIWYYEEDFDKKKLQETARKSGHSMSQYVVQLIKKALNEQKNK